MLDKIIKLITTIPLFFLGGIKYLIVSVLMFIMMTGFRMAFAYAISEIDKNMAGQLQEVVIDGFAGWLLYTTRVPEALNVVLSAYVTKIVISAIPFLKK